MRSNKSIANRDVDDDWVVYVLRYGTDGCVFFFQPLCKIHTHNAAAIMCVCASVSVALRVNGPPEDMSNYIISNQRRCDATRICAVELNRLIMWCPS